MLMSEIATGIGILGAFAAAIGGYWRNSNDIKMKVQHLEDTKEDKNGLSQNVQEIKEMGIRTEGKINDLTEKLDRLPCRDPRWKPPGCGA